MMKMLNQHNQKSNTKSSSNQTPNVGSFKWPSHNANSPGQGYVHQSKMFKGSPMIKQKSTHHETQQHQSVFGMPDQKNKRSKLTFIILIFFVATSNPNIGLNQE